MSEGDNTSVYIYNGVGRVPRNVTHVRIDPSVTVIPQDAFFNSQQLVEVKLPEGLVHIEVRAFYNCNSLKTINIPSTVTEIGDYAFDECEKLVVVHLPEGLQRLGGWAFHHCTSLQSINIPPAIEVIKEGAFCHCHSLADIKFPEGVRGIELDGFSRCMSLVSVTLPSSLRDVGEEAFEGCPLLKEIHMPDTLESIEARAFKKCNFTNFRMPPSLGNYIDISIVGGNTSLVSLELPETAGHFEDRYNNTEEHYTDLSVRNISLPSNCVTVAAVALNHCTELGVVFPDADVDTISTALKTRFNELPIHKICYYQSYHDNETTLQHLRREINPWTSKPPGQLNLTGKEQDCLGMTPLHILACSTKPTIQMFQLLIEKYPETLIMKDKWGDIPLMYAIWCNAPTEILDLLVESYNSLHPEFEFDWSGMILTLAKRNVPLANIQTLIKTQQDRFPNQKYDIQQVVMELVVHDTNPTGLRRRYTSIETFRYLLQISITKRLDSLDVKRFQVDMENSINAVSLAKGREEDTRAVYDRLAAYEIAKEGASILELALWKDKIDESHSKRARVDAEVVSYRDQCRINCGAGIIIRNVLPYLVPKTLLIPRRVAGSTTEIEL